MPVRVDDDALYENIPYLNITDLVNSQYSLDSLMYVDTSNLAHSRVEGKN